MDNPWSTTALALLAAALALGLGWARAHRPLSAQAGIANRRQVDRRLGEEWLRALRHGLPLALQPIDADHFKRYNDRHGHPAGADAQRPQPLFRLADEALHRAEREGRDRVVALPLAA
ncbi:MAG: hypothetical protein Fur0014_06770 [Rubrivivax sp.]